MRVLGAVQWKYADWSCFNGKNSWVKVQGCLSDQYQVGGLIPLNGRQARQVIKADAEPAVPGTASVSPPGTDQRDMVRDSGGRGLSNVQGSGGRTREAFLKLRSELSLMGGMEVYIRGHLLLVLLPLLGLQEHAFGLPARLLPLIAPSHPGQERSHSAGGTKAMHMLQLRAVHRRRSCGGCRWQEGGSAPRATPRSPA